MSQDVMTNLYDTTKNYISMHLKNIFGEGELEKYSVIKKFLTTASDAKNYNVLHYNLDAIIAVGYRINSKKAHEEYDKYMQKHLTTAEQYYLEILNKEIKEIYK